MHDKRRGRVAGVFLGLDLSPPIDPDSPIEPNPCVVHHIVYLQRAGFGFQNRRLRKRPPFWSI